jgi:membrane-associated phospholipid phosphatase
MGWVGELAQRGGGLLRRGRRSRRRSVRWPYLAYAAGVVALAHSRRQLNLPRPPMVPVVSTVPLAVAAALPRGRPQYAATWAAYVWLFKVAWEIPYDKPEKLEPRLCIDYPIRLDSLLGAGTPPGQRLQSALRKPPCVSALDIAITALHYVLWAAPHAVLAWFLVNDEQRFPRAAGRLAAGYHVSTLGYWCLPTAPPWWASEQEGRMEGQLQHITRDVTIAIKQRLFGARAPTEVERRASDRSEGNPWGSMPSDALPAAAITARTLGEISKTAGALGWALTAVDGFVLVYLGEHYVTDLIAGLVLVELIWRGEPFAAPLVRTVTAGLRTLERAVS